ncbi:hypothetical protein BMS3Abin16_01133 [archaeon BMS3Abin16]|nr:hypothetical protein BMS3Abin16_01133 [archaeon BMS3Abin16]
MSYLHAVVTIANIVLLALLVYYFYQSYKDVKSKFALGLVFFAVVLLMNGFFLLPMFYEIFTPSHSCPYDPYYTLAGIFEFFALIILLYIVRE